MALYAWGGNASQQIGVDSEDKQIFDVRPVTALQGHVLVDFSAGEKHSLAVNEFGDVFAWGRNKEGQLGVGRRDDAVVRHPERVTALDGQIITKVSCGDSHSVALTVTGEVFMWGLLPETLEVKNDGVFDQASVSLAGLEDGERDDDAEIAQDFMARLLSGSEAIYEAEHLTKHDVDDTETSLAHMVRKKEQTVRRVCFTPRLSTSLLSHRIVNIAAGFAHSLAVTADGVVFSCGYNDNGQLGIGSRRNSANFTRVQGLDGYVITQIACGQQHSMACSQLIEAPVASSRHGFPPEMFSGMVFSWGLGILGQLGLGINISWLPMVVHLQDPVVSIAAGSHHSVAVTTAGRVYSWGHSEYGQHGAGERYNDLQHNLYYFFPRLQEALDADGVLVDSVACSSHSTFALARDGSVYSWGWNAFGVLGNGKYQYSVDPQKVDGLKDNVAVHVGAGSNHCAVIVRPRGCHYSLSYDKILSQGEFCDLAFIVAGKHGGVNNAAAARAQTATRLEAHQVVVCARSGYLRGLLRVIRDAQQFDDVSDGASQDDNHSMLVIREFEDVDVQVFRAFLLFLYANRVDIASHKRQALKTFAERVCLDELANECQVVWRRQKIVPEDKNGESAEDDGLVPGNFEQDMQRMALSRTFADVEFLWPKHNGAEIEEGEGITELEETKQSEMEYVRLPAHKAILSQVSYFHTMFTGGFSEGRQAQSDAKNGETATSSSRGEERKLHQIALHHMPQDGISLEAFRVLLTWIYTGSVALLRLLEPRAMMELYVAASLMSLTVLANLCEMQLIKLLPILLEDRESLQACHEFAIQFDARRLKTLSERAVAKSDFMSKESASGGTDDDGTRSSN